MYTYVYRALLVLTTYLFTVFPIYLPCLLGGKIEIEIEITHRQACLRCEKGGDYIYIYID